MLLWLIFCVRRDLQRGCWCVWVGFLCVVIFMSASSVWCIFKSNNAIVLFFSSLCVRIWYFLWVVVCPIFPIFIISSTCHSHWEGLDLVSLGALSIFCCDGIFFMLWLAAVMPFPRQRRLNLRWFFWRASFFHSFLLNVLLFSEVSDEMSMSQLFMEFLFMLRP